jgi:hypothetical protein
LALPSQIRDPGSPESRQEISGAASSSDERPGGERCGRRHVFAVDSGATWGPTETIAPRPLRKPAPPHHRGRVHRRALVTARCAVAPHGRLVPAGRAGCAPEDMTWRPA